MASMDEHAGQEFNPLLASFQTGAHRTAGDHG